MKANLKKYLLYALLLIPALGMIFPMIWMLLLSIVQYPEKYKNISQLIKKYKQKLICTESIAEVWGVKEENKNKIQVIESFMVAEDDH